MEIIEENKLANETLGGVSLSSQPIDDPHKILNPSLDKNEVGGGGTVVVTTTTVVEKTEVSVVKMLQEDKDDILKKDEGVFGNLVDGDEGTKVNCSENGGSLGMDLEVFFGGEKSELNAASLADKHDEKAPGDLMDVCLSGQKEEKNENRLHIFEWNDDKNEEHNDKKLAENQEEYDEEQDESEEEEEEHDFVVGDFVWGKIKSHPWWPGQIYDPSDASDYASTLKRKGRLLAAYFGDGSFSWCQPSQLKLFIDHYPEMSVQSDSKKFVNAVQKSLEEISRLVEAELMRKSEPVVRVEMNSGIKKGVRVPKGNTVSVLMDGLQPVELLSTLKDLAKVDPGTRQFELELEFAVLKSCVSAFYCQKGGYLLQKYSEPKCIEGLEDETRSGSYKNRPSENGHEKVSQRRKQKSVAELLGEDEPKIKKAKTSKDGGSNKTKRKALVVSVSPESDHESGGGSGGVEEGTMSPRQRKRSKYLSPPYLSPIGGVKLSGLGSGSFKEPKTEPERGSQKRKVPDIKDPPPKMIDADVDVNKVLQGLLHAALDPWSFVEKNLAVVSSFRSCIFKNGSNHNQAVDVKKDVSLTVEFPPEVALPTKAHLLKTYKKCGELIKKETQMDGSRALVVFGSSGDAEAALAMSLEEKPFGDVKYRVSQENVKTVAPKLAGCENVSDLALIEQKLERMNEMVGKCEENEMNANVKASLEQGIREVLDKVCKMRRK